MKPPVTFALTSCGRFNLLELTLSTFLSHNTYPIDRFLLIEDSGNEAVRDICSKFSSAIEVIINSKHMGLMSSLDLLYRKIDTEFIFHCEDDWVFYRNGFIEDSIPLLEQNPFMSMVSCRGEGLNVAHNANYKSATKMRLGSVSYRFPPPIGNPWCGYSFNPGLRRLSNIKQIGYFTAFKNESAVNNRFTELGFNIGYLENTACETTAFGKSIRKTKNNFT